VRHDSHCHAGFISPSQTRFQHLHFIDSDSLLSDSSEWVDKKTRGLSEGKNIPKPLSYSFDNSSKKWTLSHPYSFFRRFQHSHLLKRLLNLLSNRLLLL